jgi:hypothetical protein
MWKVTKIGTIILNVSQETVIGMNIQYCQKMTYSQLNLKELILCVCGFVSFVLFQTHNSQESVDFSLVIELCRLLSYSNFIENQISYFVSVVVVCVCVCVCV